MKGILRLDPGAVDWWGYNGPMSETTDKVLALEEGHTREIWLLSGDPFQFRVAALRGEWPTSR